MAAIRDGDRNTRYFHLSTITRRKYNRIEALRDSSGNWVVEPDKVKLVVLEYFSTHFTEPEMQETRTRMLTHRFPPIKEDTDRKVCKPFNTTDIHEALHNMDPRKEPGPDGYHALFFQKHGALVGKSVSALALDVLRGAHIPNGLNNTFLTLIPKVLNPPMVTHFRPIRLCNVVYKIIT